MYQTSCIKLHVSEYGASGSGLALDLVREGGCVILGGKPGRGKTHLAVAIAYRAIHPRSIDSQQVRQNTDSKVERLRMCRR
jgi:DNA helicase TIP49 (TBP-interacting protein)